MDKTGEYFLDLGVHTCLESERIFIEILSPERFRVQKLLIPANIAKDFTIDWIKIGNKHQFLSTGSLPAILFNDDCKTPFGLKGDLVDGIIKVSVINKSKEARQFRGVLAGIREEKVSWYL